MKHFKMMVVAFLVISIFINVRLLFRVGDMEKQMKYLTYTQSDTKSSVDYQANQVRNILDEFLREQSWISPIRMDVNAENVGATGTTLSFNWQIKELFNDSKVVFHYKFGEADQYSSVPALELGNGRFEVEVPVDIEFEPEWNTMISRSTTNSQNSISDVEEVQEVAYDHTRANMSKGDLSYYVTVSNGDLLKSSEIIMNNIGHLGSSYYGVLEAYVHIQENGYYIRVSTYPGYSESYTLLEEIYLLTYNNGRLISEEELPREGSDRPRDPYEYGYYEIISNESPEFTSLILKAIYSDGRTFEKEVYSQ